jgi:hypothetical protein
MGIGGDGSGSMEAVAKAGAEDDEEGDDGESRKGDEPRGFGGAAVPRTEDVTSSRGHGFAHVSPRSGDGNRIHGVWPDEANGWETECVYEGRRTVNLNRAAA